MKYRGIVDPKGELFAYLQGDRIYTLDHEPTGQLQDGFVVDLGGNPIWRVFGDGIYTIDGVEPIGFFSGEGPSDYSDY